MEQNLQIRKKTAARREAGAGRGWRQGSWGPGRSRLWGELGGLAPGVGEATGWTGPWGGGRSWVDWPQPPSPTALWPPSALTQDSPGNRGCFLSSSQHRSQGRGGRVQQSGSRSASAAPDPDGAAASLPGRCEADSAGQEALIWGPVRSKTVTPGSCYFYLISCEGS